MSTLGKRLDRADAAIAPKAPGRVIVFEAGNHPSLSTCAEALEDKQVGDQEVSAVQGQIGGQGREMDLARAAFAVGIIE